jgi:tetratricopeptide (TPR) repeat protein
MKSTSILSFNPNAMSPETLEKIFVQRHQLAESLVEQIRESATTNHKSFQLLVGMRGIGKTHLISLIYHRVAKMEEVPDKLLIAWLREEEWGVESFLDLLLRIFRALEKEYPTEYKEIINQQVEALYKLPPEEAEQNAARLLREFVGERTLLLLMENLDELFKGFTKTGQQQFLDYIQTYSFITILATATKSFAKKSPCYELFTCSNLKEFNIDDAVALLRQIAELDEDKDKDTALISFMQTPTGRARVEAIHQLAGGNPRVYIIFSQFLSCKSLDELVEPFRQTLNELTPYYQARMQSLSSQQRKIIEFLVDRRSAVSVKEIAQRCFISQQTTASQLKKLFDLDYVRSTSKGRESYYELREVLMRFCLEVKKQRGEVVCLFVDFLRLWCTREELQERLEKLSVAEMSQESYLERAHLAEALQEMSQDSLQLESNVLDLKSKGKDPQVEAYWDELQAYVEQNDWLSALSIAEKLLEIQENAAHWLVQGLCLTELQRYSEAIASYDKALSIKPDKHDAWFNRGIALYKLGKYEQAIASYDKALSIKPDKHEAWNNRGIALYKLGEYEQAIASYDKALSIKPDDHQAWFNRGIALDELGESEQAIASYDKAIEINPNYRRAWFNRGWVLDLLGRYEEALASCDKAIELGDHDQSSSVFFNRAIALLGLNRWEKGITSLEEAFNRLKNTEKADTEDAELILRDLFNNTKDAASWKTRLTTLIELYNKYQALPTLGTALVRQKNIDALMSDMVSDKAAQLWLEIWQEVASDYDSLQIPLRLLGATVRYRVTKGDQRALLELPMEERDLLKPLLQKGKD